MITPDQLTQGMGKRHFLRVLDIIRNANNNPTVWLALALLIILGTGKWILPLPFDPVQPNAGSPLSPPSMAHLFGTDSSGFDLLSRTLAAGSRDIPLALAATIISTGFGVPLGLAATSAGRGGELIMRGLDAFQAFPLIILAIAIVTLTGNHLSNVVFAIVLINIPRFMRLVRAEGLSIRESRYVEAAQIYGCSKLRIMFFHVLPNVFGIILAQASLTAANSIIVIASLNFLGIGVSPPEASWGSMIQAGAQNMTTGQWWVVAAPGCAVLLVVTGLNVIADAADRRLSR